MDDVTRKAALGKATAVTDMIGFPEYVRDPDALAEKYEELNVTRGQYFQNGMNSRLASTKIK